MGRDCGLGPHIFEAQNMYIQGSWARSFDIGLEGKRRVTDERLWQNLSATKPVLPCLDEICGFRQLESKCVPETSRPAGSTLAPALTPVLDGVSQRSCRKKELLSTVNRGLTLSHLVVSSPHTPHQSEIFVLSRCLQASLGRQYCMQAVQHERS